MGDGSKGRILAQEEQGRGKELIMNSIKKTVFI
jgi:hypothetical protein